MNDMAERKVKQIDWRARQRVYDRLLGAVERRLWTQMVIAVRLQAGRRIGDLENRLADLADEVAALRRVYRAGG
ncbi:MAG: hypothetical protein A2Y61_00360 [Chloroflexi bacterium RBG_13_60_13]|nr:MAG: hypothetical protein A2Y61_00360 [Chloroflexi bacterium RBG_13_60_13]